MGATVADALAVPCPDCAVPAGTACRTSVGALEGETHAERRRVAYLRSLEQGTCALCGRLMVRGTDPVIAWHPDPDAAAACPVLPDPSTDWNAYAEAVNAGLSPGYPGTEHFVPTPTLDPVHEGHGPNCRCDPTLNASTHLAGATDPMRPPTT